MKSQRTSTSVDARLLAAIRQAVVVHGVRRTTANDIAERAGISRMTFYRRMGSVENAVLVSLTEEFRTFTADVPETPGTGRERLVRFAVESVRVFATSELLASIAERDPEFLIPYVTDRFGSSQQLILDRLHAMLDDGVADGSIESADATATMLLLALQGVALSCRVLLRTGVFEAALAELATMLERYLTPSGVNSGGRTTDSER
ncbi:AcrR family transcriptional regulator [Arthrobacter stackebrandtii]|uniref:AcrR family transcriptional regulator n=1 Tax=Arthrobacter stackebrandtii TaxID=272161 RepID=A0ABS4YWA6_9MICC|nr:TetR/AcrR family transcriptional regulator [Arthrobacter stackebrandtii]MBP2413110.1 AcrR family transcriptional regulator [Arthrobacter stackebrandtii]PYH01123.1 TetR family transcriptional regulator [Arthrobacter stackebrandtii]